MKPTRILKAAFCPNWWLAAHSRLHSMVLVAMLVPLCQSLAHAAGTWVAFGPQTFVRGSGAPTQVTASFSVLNPNTVYVLRINNGGLNGEFARSSGVITLNGVRIFGPLLLNPLVPVLEWPVLLHSNNQLGIQLQGTTGSGIVVQVIGVDIKPPVISGTISPPPNAAGWNNSDVTVSFTCSDQTSGVASCSPPVVLTSEGAHQVVSGTVTDKAGNKATTSVTVNLDKTPPVIVGSINPPPDAGGWNSSAVTVSFGCSDQLSGMASCSPPVALTTEGAGQLVTGTATDIAGNTATAQITVNISTKFFSVRNYGGKCLDYGPPWQGTGTTVFLNDCAVAHPIRAEEINDKHEVVLHAGTQVIAIHNPVQPVGIAPPPPRTEFALELQTYNPALASTANQIFRLDGDSIILEGEFPCLSTNDTLCPPPPPQLVVQTLNARGASGSPLVVGPRNLADSEFWDFNAIDGSDKDPTSGFIRVSALCDLLQYIPLYNPPNPCYANNVPPSAVTPNTVFKFAPGAAISFYGLQPLQVPSGVTFRGNRRGSLLGPCLFQETACDDYTAAPNAPGESMFEIRGDDVRFTGLRLQGASRSTDQNQITSVGIYAHDGATEHYLRTIIDHNDISSFTVAGVKVDGNDDTTINSVCDPNDNPYTRPLNVVVARNFIHHNREQEKGYGVVSSIGAFPLVEGNTFVSNRHSIAGTGTSHTGYRGWFNLVLSNSPLQTHGPFDFYVQDFDMHGLGTGNGLLGLCEICNGYGILGGDYVDIYGNTFLGTNRRNYELRAEPCHHTDYHWNVSLQSQDDSLLFKDSNLQTGNRIEYIDIAPDPPQFNFPNPTDQLGTGDFDGDGSPDVFLASGTAWYYSPLGKAEWRFLNSGKTDKIDTLLFGDFDGDRRTDVLGINGSNLMVSWGGVSDWEVLNSIPAGASIVDMAVGDFDGDGYADIFYADGTNWYLSSGGTGPFNLINTSSFHRRDLRFGDFDGDGRTDVFAVVSNGTINTWSYSKSATGAWADGFLQEALAPIDRLVIADFDGDGYADVMTRDQPLNALGANGYYGIITWNWMISYGGIHNWTSYQIAPKAGDVCTLEESLSPIQVQPTNFSMQVVGVGPFEGNRGSDVLVWNANNFCIVPGGLGDPQPFGRQDMR